MSAERNEGLPRRPHLTIDLVGLDEVQRQENSMFLGGATAECITDMQGIDYLNVNSVVFRWGDSAAEDKLAILFEHISENDVVFSTVINDRIWMLAPQPKGFSPHKAYESTDQYELLPYEITEAKKALDHHESLNFPRPQLLGKLGSRYVLFELSAELKNTDPNSQPPDQHEIVEPNEALDFFTKALETHDFESLSIEEALHFGVQYIHTILELFGQESRDGRFSLENYDDTPCPGIELPQSLQHLVAVWDGEGIRHRDENTLWLTSEAEHIESEPTIPRWEEIEALPTFKDQLAFARANPDIIQGIVPSQIDAWPAIKLLYEAPRDYKWGLWFKITPHSIEAAPWGEPSATMAPTNFVLEHQGKPRELIETVCHIALLTAKYSPYKKNSPLPRDASLFLAERINGESTIPRLPLSKQKLDPNIIKKNHFIRNLLTDEEVS